MPKRPHPNSLPAVQKDSDVYRCPNMDRFIETFRHFATLKKFDPEYRFCWFPFDQKGNGRYLCIALSEEEVKKTNPEILQVICM